MTDLWSRVGVSLQLFLELVKVPADHSGVYDPAPYADEVLLSCTQPVNVLQELIFVYAAHTHIETHKMTEAQADAYRVSRMHSTAYCLGETRKSVT